MEEEEKSEFENEEDSENEEEQKGEIQFNDTKSEDDEGIQGHDNNHVNLDEFDVSLNLDGNLPFLLLSATPFTITL
ncbi:hypothetical protein HN51_008617 [Arachis hypogaea]